MFKKLVIAGAITAMVAGTALAQNTPAPATPAPNVTVYGLIDMGVMSTNAAGTANGGLTTMVSGIDQTSRIGFRAGEKLDANLSVGIALEGQIDGGSAGGVSGNQGLGSSSGSGNALFARASNVFVDHSKFGRLTMGRQGNVLWSDIGSLDGRRMSNFGSITTMIADGSLFGGTATAKTGLSTYTGGPFTSNAMRYDSPRWNGISGSYSRVFGNTAGDQDKSSADIYALRYDNNGMFYGAVGSYKANNSSGNASGSTVWGGAGARVTKDLTLTASYFDLQNPSNKGGTNGHFTIQTVGARYALTPKIDLNGAVYQLKDQNNSDNGANFQSTHITYSFSRRTQVYAAASMVQNKGATGIAAYGGGGANLNSLGTSNALSVAGADQTAYAVGLRHSF